MSPIKEQKIISKTGVGGTEDLYSCYFTFNSGHSLSFTVGYWALKQCGLMSINGIQTAGRASNQEIDEALQVVIGGIGVYSEAGNIMFSIMDTYWKHAKYSPEQQTLYAYLVNHPNTRIIHQMRNNAHPSDCGSGGNHMLICMLHLYPDQVGYDKAGDYGTTELLELKPNAKQT